jgi:hypothetical protein
MGRRRAMWVCGLWVALGVGGWSVAQVRPQAVADALSDASAEVAWETSGQPALQITDGASLGQWLMSSPGQGEPRAFSVPLDWSAKGAWRGDRLRARGGKKLTILRQVPEDGRPERLLLWGGDGLIGSDALLWRGRADGGGEAAVIEVGVDADGFAQVKRTTRPPLLPAGCEALAQPWLVMTYDFERARWVGAAPSAQTAPTAAPAALTLAPQPAPAWADSISRPAHDAATLWLTDEGARGDAAKASRDGRADTTWRAPASAGELWWTWRPHAVAPPERLTLGFSADVAAAGQATLAWEGGAAALTWPAPTAAGPWAVSAALPKAAQSSRCLMLRWPEGQALPAEIALRTPLDSQPLAAAVASLCDEFLSASPDAERRAALGALLSHHPDAVVTYLQAKLSADSTPDLLAAAFTLSERLPLEQSLLLAAALATHPHAPPDTLQRALNRLSAHPKPAAAALYTRLRSLPIDSPDYHSAALRLSRLPVPDAINPLLSLIDRACAAGDDSLRDALLSELVSVGPHIAAPLIGFASAPSMHPNTRQTLLRALLRVSSTAVAFSILSSSSPLDPRPLLPQLDSPDLQTRLLVIRVLGALRAADAADALAAHILDADNDIERAERITARAALSSPTPALDLAVLQRAAFDDPSPTVRIAATQAIASHAITSHANFDPTASAAARSLLQRVLDRELWPEARAAALEGLCDLSDPAALLRAAALLDDPDADSTLRAAAAQSLTFHPDALLRDPDRLHAWLDDPSLDRNARAAFLTAITDLPDPSAAAAFLTERTLREQSLHALDPEHGGLLLTQTLLALHRTSPPADTFAPLLLQSLDAAQHPALANGLITLLSLCDHPSTRARLLSERDSPNPSRRAAADAALDRLNGVSPPLPIDPLDPLDLP